MNNNTPIRTHLKDELAQTKAALLGNATAFIDQMQTLVDRIERGGTVNMMDSLGSRITAFETQIARATTLQKTLAMLEIYELLDARNEAEQKGSEQMNGACCQEVEQDDSSMGLV